MIAPKTDVAQGPEVADMFYLSREAVLRVRRRLTLIEDPHFFGTDDHAYPFPQR